MDCLEKLPHGWNLEIRHYGDYGTVRRPCTVVEIRRLVTGEFHCGHSYDPDVHKAIPLAIDDLLASMKGII